MGKHSAGLADDVTWQLEPTFPGEAAFGEQWNALAAAQPLPSIFQTYEWLESWWQRFGGAGRLHLVTGRSQGRLVAAAPLAVRRPRGAGTRRARVVEAVGTSGVPTRGMGLADRFDLLVAPGTNLTGELVRRTLEQLGKVDLLLLRAFPDDAAAIGVLEQVVARQGWSHERRRRSRSPYARLEGDWETFLASRDGRARRQWRNSRKRLDGAGRHGFVRFPDDGLAFDAAWSRLVDINRRSYKWAARSSLYQDDTVSGFFETFFRKAARAGWLTMLFLELDGEPIAYQLGFRYAGRRFGYDAAYDQRHAELHPGVHLVVEAIRGACEEGAVEYDMMRGEEPYKTRWATGNREEIHFVAHPPTLSGRMACLIHVHGKDRLKQSRLAQGVYHALSRLRRG